MRAKPLIEMMIPEKEEACVRMSKRMTGQERLGRGEKNVKRIEGKEKNRKSLTENVRENLKIRGESNRDLVRNILK